MNNGTVLRSVYAKVTHHNVSTDCETLFKHYWITLHTSLGVHVFFRYAAVSSTWSTR